MREAPTISEWLYRGKVFPDEGRLEILWRDVKAVMAGDYEHIFRAFIKMEPHKAAKAREGRWRLIIQSALCVQVAWKMAFSHIEQSLLDNMGSHPSAYGEVWFGGGWRRFKRRAERLGTKWCLDKRAWDWNSPGYIYEDIKELRIRLTLNPTEEWLRVVDLLYDDAYVNSVILVGDKLYRQTVPGLMKSGLLVTISDNSFAQVLLDRYACVRLRKRFSRIFATGDDTIQDEPEDAEAYVDVLQTFGCVVKEAVRGVEFMGTVFTENGPRPLYGGKHLKNITMVADEDVAGVLDSYMRVYAHCPVFTKFWRKLAVSLGVRVKSDAYYRWFYDSPEALERGRFLDCGHSNHADTTRAEAMIV